MLIPVPSPEAEGFSGMRSVLTYSGSAHESMLKARILSARPTNSFPRGPTHPS